MGKVSAYDKSVIGNLKRDKALHRRNFYFNFHIRYGLEVESVAY